MAWEFAAVWIDDPDQGWKWIWRHLADDGGALLGESGEFPQLDDCIEDARRNGFDESDGD
jgi:hypothetical protein